MSLAGKKKRRGDRVASSKEIPIPVKKKLYILANAEYGESQKLKKTNQKGRIMGREKTERSF